MKLITFCPAVMYLLIAGATAVTSSTTSLSLPRDNTANNPSAEAHVAVAVNTDESADHSHIDTGIGGFPSGGGACSTYACDYGLNMCVEKCGNGPQCKPYCSCKLHSSPKSLCRVHGCVKAPKNCDKYDMKKRSVSDMDSSDPVVAPLNVARPPGPINPCFACEMEYNVCVKKCGLGPGCPATCKCQLTGPNPLCTQCPSLQCPTFVRRVR